MTQTYTYKVFIIGFLLFGLLFAGYVTSSDAHAKENQTGSSARNLLLRKSKTDDRMSTSTASTTKNRGGKNVDATCMQTAVAAREASLSSAWETFSTSIKDALTKRAAALDTAWGLSDVTARTKALTDAWKTWRGENKAAHDALKKTRKSAWDTFKKTAKDSCKVTTPKAEGLEKDGSGSVSL